MAIKGVINMFHDLVDAKRILREVKLLRHLRGHENVVELLDLMTAPPHTSKFKDLYIVTNLFDTDMQRIIASSQPVSERHVQYLAYQILRGLKWIHSASVMHRDLKPANLLVNASCELVICDFGLARFVGEDDAAPKTEYVMTRWYRAPEVLCGAMEYGPQADVWSAGLIVAELFTRGPLFKGTSSMHQLQCIFELLGTPDAAVLRRLATPDAFPEITSLGVFPPTPLEGLLRGASADAVDLISRMLQFDPAERITVEVRAWLML